MCPSRIDFCATYRFRSIEAPKVSHCGPRVGSGQPRFPFSACPFASPSFTFFYFSLFSERELTFTFAIYYRPSVCHLSVCNVRAPYSGGSNFRQYFYGIRYRSHPLTSTENFTEIVPGEPLRRGVRQKRGSQV